MKIITAESMRRLDEETISKGTAGLELMERAGVGVAHEIEIFINKLSARHSRRILLICGKGNNGGDGYVIARHLVKLKHVGIISLVKQDELSDDALMNARRLPTEVEMIHDSDIGQYIREGDIIIDCMLGTGLKSNVREPYLKAIESINNSGRAVIAVDIASGINGNNGEVMGCAVKADMTVSIGMIKYGNILGAGANYSGSLRVVDIGIDEQSSKKVNDLGEAITRYDVVKSLSRRIPSLHKYECGNVKVVGGSRHYMGAPFLAATAALRSGGGMVTCIIPAKISDSVPREPKGLITIPVATDCNTFQNSSWTKVEAALAIGKLDTVIVGPGLCGIADEEKVVAEVLKHDSDAVIDAGALAVLTPNMLKARQRVAVLTPHGGELKTLAKNFGFDAHEDCEDICRKIARNFEVYIILKGRFSRLFTPDGRMLINSSGSLALAKAGSGDVLCGLCAAMMSNMNTEEALKCALYIHGLAGEMSPYGDRGLIADDLIKLVPEAMKEVSPFA